MPADYITQKNARTAALANDPRCAITHFVKFHTERGCTFTIQSTDVAGDNDSLCPARATDVLDIIRAVFEIEIATFAITNAQGGSGGWVTFMYPSDLTCAPSESVTDYGLNPTTSEWEKAWDAHIDPLGY